MTKEISILSPLWNNKRMFLNGQICGIIHNQELDAIPLMRREVLSIQMKKRLTYASMRKILFIFAVLSVGTISPGLADACEPMYPFLLKFVFPSSMTGSFFGLLAGVIVKCALFAFLVRQITWLKATGSMFLANIITSFFGLLLVVALSINFVLILLPLVCYIATLPSKSLQERMGEKLPDWLHRAALAAFLFFALPFNGFLFYAAENANPHTGYYWFIKLAYIYAGLAIGIGMTTLWEEWLVFSFAKPKSGTNLLSAVLRTNLYTFLVLAFIGAAFAIPHRLSNPGFLFFGN